MSLQSRQGDGLAEERQAAVAGVAFLTGLFGDDGAEFHGCPHHFGDRLKKLGHTKHLVVFVKLFYKNDGERRGFRDGLPLCRQAQIMEKRFDVPFNRTTLADWMIKTHEFLLTVLLRLTHLAYPLYRMAA